MSRKPFIGELSGPAPNIMAWFCSHFAKRLRSALLSTDMATMTLRRTVIRKRTLVKNDAYFSISSQDLEGDKLIHIVAIFLERPDADIWYRFLHDRQARNHVHRRAGDLIRLLICVVDNVNQAQGI